MIERYTPVEQQRYEFMLDSVRRLGKDAWRLIRQGDVTATTKPDGSIVTSVDESLNHSFIDMVGCAFPDDAVWGEEASNSERHDTELADSKWVWLIDPIDGTKGFWRAIETNDFSKANTTILIAGFRPGATSPTMAVVSNPFNGQPSMLIRYAGSTLYRTSRSRDAQTIRVPGNGPTTLDEVQRYDESSWPGAAIPKGSLGSIMPFARRVNHPLGFVSVALGDADIGIFPGEYPHDSAAAASIVQAAGGAVSSLHSEPYEAMDWRQPVNGVIVAHNETLRQAVLERLHENNAA